MGRIGKAIEHRASAFGMQVGYHSRRHTEDRLMWFPTAVELATWADVLITALPGGAQTRHLVDARVLSALGSKGIFINIARGSIVDEAALIEALRSGTIAAAALDVYEKQPNDASQFAGLSNVILTPHIGSLTTETRFAMADSVYGNVKALLSGSALHGLATLPQSQARPARPG
jgi:lactate dehydrogenase-like 2-hydroxyacid dehydrogenase